MRGLVAGGLLLTAMTTAVVLAFQPGAPTRKVLVTTVFHRDGRGDSQWWASSYADSVRGGALQPGTPLVIGMPLDFSKGYTSAKVISVRFRTSPERNITRLHTGIDLGSSFLVYTGKWPVAHDHVVPLRTSFRLASSAAVAYSAARAGIYVFRRPVLSGVAYRHGKKEAFRETLHLNYIFCVGHVENYCSDRFNKIVNGS